jgi:hypothetical protein
MIHSITLKMIQQTQVILLRLSNMVQDVVTLWMRCSRIVLQTKRIDKKRFKMK